ncbi:DNA polymerase III subunit delta [Virgibacillus sp. NKC19-3]|uniref:DNA polymerase III subunit delta n=1 Tax=Virgibacillus saliphilus TaxID=2831674 RepID=UPI001C9ACDC1|nr:DNA polymerase III subunit delta [Virgibacillus sp. NKC19-3]MBY7143329.1 DNA polymerase III subunit delta [Virgibacillus sp. NKC19-3]
MSYLEVLQQIKKKNISPVFLLYGSESYFIQNLKKQLTKEVLADDLDNLTTYDLEETPIQEVIADAETYPFFGERKLIIANNPGFLKAKPDKSPFEHDLDGLKRYLESPVDYSILVIIAPYEKIDERKKITKILKKNATVAICEPIKEYDLAKWLKNLASQLHVTIADDAYEIFDTALSANLQLLENELTKMASFVGENGTITRGIAEKLISHTTNGSSLRLADAVIERNLHKAIAVYKDLEKMKEEPIALIGLLAYQFRMMLRVKLLKSKGYSQPQIQKQLGVHPYVVKMALKREKQFTAKRLQDIMDRLANTDAEMKTGEMEKGLAFELLLYELVQAS